MAQHAEPILIVLGIAGWIPVSGVTWQALHYLEGFRRLGYDVYYVEDTLEWPYDHERNTFGDDPTYTVNYLTHVMAWSQLSDRWAYRFAGKRERTYGLPADAVERLFLDAAVLVNLTGATVLREEHLRVPVRILVETDPFRPQVEVAQGNPFTVEMHNTHTHVATFAENIGEPDCLIPLSHVSYIRTRQPVILDWWTRDSRKTRSSQTEDYFTTISRWEQSEKSIRWNGATYLWSKHVAFSKFLDVPHCTGARFQVALATDEAAVIDLWQSNGWAVIDAAEMSRDMHAYRDFIRGSRGEFTVAKEQYVVPRTGWFSDRSACYLAAGKPVITQDTGFGKFMPTGEGLFAFSTMHDIQNAIDAVTRDYETHSRAAQSIAKDHFRAETVLAQLLTAAGVEVDGAT